MINMVPYPNERKHPRGLHGCAPSTSCPLDLLFILFPQCHLESSFAPFASDVLRTPWQQIKYA